MQHSLLWPDMSIQHAAHLRSSGGQSQSAEGIKHCCSLGVERVLAVAKAWKSDPHILNTTEQLWEGAHATEGVEYAFCVSWSEGQLKSSTP